jgi:tetratricopeptide (TPR) repeat protein
MFPAWRIQLRTARRAVADGRWDEAAEMLASAQLREFLPAKRLSQDLAVRLVERARGRLANGQSQAGWRDLNQAVRLGAAEADVAELRRRQAGERLARAIEWLASGDTAAAKGELERMHERNLGGNDRRAWQVIAQHLENADGRAIKGELTVAVESLERARRLIPVDAGAAVVDLLNRRIEQLRGDVPRLQELDARLHRAIMAADWTEALTAAEAVLELAPQHTAARQARQRAWHAVGMQVTRAPQPGGRPPRGVKPLQALASTHAHARSAKADTVTERNVGKRIVAWIDAVGGFLVCLGDEIVLGQPVADGSVDVPFLADLSRRHAIIRREGEAYVLTPLQRTTVDGLAVKESVVLRDKCIVKLGEAVELRFRKPHALSNTAVLEIQSRHKTEPAVDGIILMSESCILGPQSHSHVRCRQWSSDLVLFRRGDELMCRTHSPLEIDGQTCVGQAAVGGNCRIESEEFALSLEEI